MALHIQRLAAGDGDSLAELNQLFSRDFEDQAYSAAPPNAAYLQRFLANDSHIVLAAWQDESLAGELVAYHLDKFEQARSEVFIYDVAVTPAYQRQGIGKALMNQLQKIAKQLGAYVVFVQADEGDAAVHFYESLAPSENIRCRNFDFTVI